MRTVIVIFHLIVFAAIFPGTTPVCAKETFPAKITEKANLWQAPDIRSGAILELPKDAQVLVLAKSQGWYRVLYKTRTFGVDGWVFGTVVQVADQALETSIPNVKTFSLVADDGGEDDKTPLDGLKNKDPGQAAGVVVAMKKKEYQKPADLNAGLEDLELEKPAGTSGADEKVGVADISGLDDQYLEGQSLDDLLSKDDERPAQTGQGSSFLPGKSMGPNTSGSLVSGSLQALEPDPEKRGEPMNPRHIEALDEAIGFSGPQGEARDQNQAPKPVPVFSEVKTDTGLQRIDQESRLAKSRPSPIRSARDIPVALAAATSFSKDESASFAGDSQKAPENPHLASRMGKAETPSGKPKPGGLRKTTDKGFAMDQKPAADAPNADKKATQEPDLFQVWLRTGIRVMSVIFSCLALLLSLAALRRAGR